jgi:hypothetical protein
LVIFIFIHKGFSVKTEGFKVKRWYMGKLKPKLEFLLKTGYVQNISVLIIIIIYLKRRVIMKKLLFGGCNCDGDCNCSGGGCSDGSCGSDKSSKGEKTGSDHSQQQGGE